MPVNRISEKSLHKLLKETINEEALCVIKFYSNGCEYCHNLQEYYQEIATSYEGVENVYFFAFNVDDVPEMDKLIKLNGVPSIATIKTGLLKPRIRMLQDPDPPNKSTWYYSNDIKEFIEKEK
tara:strand:+ start:670 stop:1038 length:369 start_codon:yes stop_codon:yes gene_type:complete